MYIIFQGSYSYGLKSWVKSNHKFGRRIGPGLRVLYFVTKYSDYSVCLELHGLRNLFEFLIHSNKTNQTHNCSFLATWARKMNPRGVYILEGCGAVVFVYTFGPRKVNLGSFVLTYTSSNCIPFPLVLPAGEAPGMTRRSVAPYVDDIVVPIRRPLNPSSGRRSQIWAPNRWNICVHNI